MMSESNNSKTAKWYTLIGCLKELIAREGKEINLLTIKPDKDIARQISKFQKACGSKSNKIEVLVATSLL